MTTRTINVKSLARVEGQGAVTLVLDGDNVVDAKVRILEPPRLFEAFLRGRDCTETPDITSRICGICPIAYMMSASTAVEDALGIRVDGTLRDLRRLLYCGEWIESHMLHMVMLHAPDFLRVPDVVAIAKLHPERVEAALRVKKAGNAIVATLGGRSIHPVNVKVGGMYRTPRRSEVEGLLPELRAALDEAEQTLDWLATFDFPSFERDYELVALRHESEYPVMAGRIVSTKGLDIEIRELEQCISEEQAPYSTALQARLLARGAYKCGPLSRFALNADRLSPRASAAAARIGLVPSCRNPFRSLLVRGVEVIHALDEAIRIIEGYTPPPEPSVPYATRAATGYGATEAPRGMLYHRYEIDERGIVQSARIIPPTSQNQRSMEEDLVALGPVLVNLSLDDATRRVEHNLRNYDPCISCSTHFLTLRFEQTGTT
ncbi:MAG TPA: nickel-dependent hydrogenase large subunit [Labilithrix sp.]|nr:nickel-dependent hydrogenase large subunit [Labilithrix sp.]